MSKVSIRRFETNNPSNSTMLSVYAVEQALAFMHDVTKFEVTEREYYTADESVQY